jgi:ribosomal protein S13
MTSTHLFFNNVFAETHPELIDLEESFANLRINYMPNSIINKNEEIVDEAEVSHDEIEESCHETVECDHETEALSKEQIDKFRNIYNKNKIIDDQVIDLEEQMEIDNDIDHYVKNLLEKNCCQKECLKKNLNFNNVKTRYKCFLNLRKTEQDIFLKGILSASLRNKTTTKNEKRIRLASVYFFDGTEICRTAFMGIYGIGNTRWNNIRNHFDDFDIQLRTNSLTGKASNRAISFDGVLQIIKFILNYSNMNGLPSPGK